MYFSAEYSEPESYSSPVKVKKSIPPPIQQNEVDDSIDIHIKANNMAPFQQTSI